MTFKTTDRPTYEEYQAWVCSKFSENFDATDRLVYGSNAQQIKNAAENHEFFRELRWILADADRAFHARTNARLFPHATAEPSLTLHQKTFESAVEKSYRINILRNQRFPEAPRKGWVLPSTWYSTLNDIVRGTLVCGYLDALPWLAARLRDEATKRSLSVEFNHEERDEGYYAYHCYVTLPAMSLQVRKASDIVLGPDVAPMIEIQLTTQLQDALKDVTHFYYENRRMRGLPPDWKWNHDAPHFRASYISHSLHLVDALIVELRDGVAEARVTPRTEVSSRIGEDATEETKVK